MHGAATSLITSSTGMSVGIAHLGYSIATTSYPILVVPALALTAAVGLAMGLDVCKNFRSTEPFNERFVQGFAHALLVQGLLVGAVAIGACLSSLSPGVAAASVLAAGGSGYLLETQDRRKLETAVCLSGWAALMWAMNIFPSLAYLTALLQALLVGAHLSVLFSILADRQAVLGRQSPH